MSIDHVAVARILESDGLGRRMPACVRCRQLVSGELFLLNAYHPASFDSRYFGPIDASFVIGKAIPLWTKP